LNKIDTDLSMF